VTRLWVIISAILVLSFGFVVKKSQLDKLKLFLPL